MTSRKYHETDIGELYDRVYELEDRIRKMQNDKIQNFPIRVSSQLSSIVGAEGDVVVTDIPAVTAAGSSLWGFVSGAWKLLGGGATTRDLIVVIDGGGSAITTGVKGDVSLDFACTIQGWTLLADQSGSIVIDIWKDLYANYPPTVADTITASAKPTISSATKATSTTLTGWTTAIAAGDTLRFNVDSATTVQRVTLMLKLLG